MIVRAHPTHERIGTDGLGCRFRQVRQQMIGISF